MDRTPTEVAAHDFLNVADELGSSRAKMLLDSLGYSHSNEASRLLTLGNHVGPWRIQKLEDGSFRWDIREPVKVVDELKYRVRPHATHRENPAATRMLLIGESAAGSWGYFGKYSLAGVLENRLREASGQPSEVVDLSCVNANWQENCIPLIKAGMTLDPDLVVVYCGNNEARWLIPLLLSKSPRQCIDGGFNLKWNFLTGNMVQTIDGLKAYYFHRISKCVTDTVALCRKFSKPLLFVIPPYNDREWQPPERIPASLTSAQLNDWIGKTEEAESLYVSGNQTGALSKALEALEIDSGQSQRTQFLLGKIFQELKNPKEASKHFKAAPFCGMGAFVNAVPSFPNQAADFLKDTLKSFGIPYVDLPETFEAANEDESSHEGLFIDYCHLSDHGFELAAKEIVTVCGKEIFGWPVSSAGYGLKVPAMEKGLACLCAALHGHQNGQAQADVFRWLKEGLAASRELEALYQFLRNCLCSYHREWITLSYLRSIGISEDVLPGRTAIFILKFVYHARFDLDLYKMVGVALDGNEFELSYRSQTEGLLEYLQGDLKRLFFLDRRKGFGLPQKEMSRRGWERMGNGFVAHEPTGVISYPRDGNSIKRSRLQLRLSSPVPDRHFEVTVFWNDVLVTRISITHAFQDFSLELPVHCPELFSERETDELRFEWSGLIGPLDIENAGWREHYVREYGPYPIAALIHEIRLAGAKSTGD